MVLDSKAVEKVIIKCKACGSSLRVLKGLDGKVRCPVCSKTFAVNTKCVGKTDAVRASERFIFLDTETTGLYPPDDKIVEIAIVDGNGETLLDVLVNPQRPIGFATTIHGIEDYMVASSPTLDRLLPTIIDIVRNKHVVIYNAKFDTSFFPSSLSEARKVSCAMLRYAKFHGEINPRFGDYKWQKLTVAADHIGYAWEGTTHRALADTLATRAVWNWMEQNNS